ncbi:MAG: histidinol-phosphate transaminase [Oscillospiraceae bacterium]|nr:histidinol-phosphate transaminase [Oscillospiraceae bacterium]
MSYKLNNKLINLVPYDPITGHYDIRLDANESFFNLSSEMQDKITEEIRKIDFNRYPDCLAAKPIRAFSELYGIEEKYIAAGNGSDELISIITSCFLQTGDTIVNVSNDFSMYQFYSQLYEVKCETYQKNDDLTIDPAGLISFCREKNARALIFSNPCNPTSVGLDRESVLKIASSLPDTLIIADEAYMDFWDQSVLNYAGDCENLLVLKTCSKAIGLAAVRFGFAVSNEKIINALRAAKSPYNNDTVAQTIVSVILEEKEYLKERALKIIDNTQALYKNVLELNKKTGLFDKIYPTCTNFLFIETSKNEQIYSFLLENSIAVRKFPGHLRITSGSQEENKVLLEVLEKCAQQL